MKQYIVETPSVGYDWRNSSLLSVKTLFKLCIYVSLLNRIVYKFAPFTARVETWLDG
jgi:hypothetical protein